MKAIITRIEAAKRNRKYPAAVIEYYRRNPNSRKRADKEKLAKAINELRFWDEVIEMEEKGLAASRIY